jgi:hypothetical protein
MLQLALDDLCIIHGDGLGLNDFGEPGNDLLYMRAVVEEGEEARLRYEREDCIVKGVKKEETRSEGSEECSWTMAQRRECLEVPAK